MTWLKNYSAGGGYVDAAKCVRFKVVSIGGGFYAVQAAFDVQSGDTTGEAQLTSNGANLSQAACETVVLSLVERLQQTSLDVDTL